MLRPGWFQVAKSILANGAGLTDIDLSHNGLNDEPLPRKLQPTEGGQESGCSVLLNAICGCLSLTSLAVSHNRLGDRGVAAIGELQPIHSR